MYTEHFSVSEMLKNSDQKKKKKNSTPFIKVKMF